MLILILIAEARGCFLLFYLRLCIWRGLLFKDRNIGLAAISGFQNHPENCQGSKVLIALVYLCILSSTWSATPSHLMIYVFTLRS